MAFMGTNGFTGKFAGPGFFNAYDGASRRAAIDRLDMLATLFDTAISRRH